MKYYHKREMLRHNRVYVALAWFSLSLSLFSSQYKFIRDFHRHRFDIVNWGLNEMYSIYETLQIFELEIFRKAHSNIKSIFWMCCVVNVIMPSWNRCREYCAILNWISCFSGNNIKKKLQCFRPIIKIIKSENSTQFANHLMNRSKRYRRQFQPLNIVDIDNGVNVSSIENV